MKTILTAGMLACLFIGAAAGSAFAEEGKHSCDMARLVQDAVWTAAAGAEAGSAGMQFLLGLMHFRGDGVQKDYGKAKEWWEKASAQGDAAAQTALGTMHAGGFGVPQSWTKAAEWWKKAAVQGHEGALYHLGAMHAEGKGVPQDYGQALELWKKAAGLGDAASQHLVGRLYEHGLGVQTRDYAEAARWYGKAAAQGYARAQSALGFMFIKGLGVGQDYGQARIWLEKAAAQENPRGQRLLGLLHERGLGAPKDVDAAREWYRKSCAGGDKEGCADWRQLGGGDGGYSSSGRSLEVSIDLNEDPDVMKARAAREDNPFNPYRRMPTDMKFKLLLALIAGVSISISFLAWAAVRIAGRKKTEAGERPGRSRLDTPAKRLGLLALLAGLALAAYGLHESFEEHDGFYVSRFADFEYGFARHFLLGVLLAAAGFFGMRGTLERLWRWILRGPEHRGMEKRQAGRTSAAVKDLRKKEES